MVGTVQGSSIAPVMAFSAREGFSVVLPSTGEPSIVHATRMGGRQSCEGGQDGVSLEEEKGVVLDFAKLTAQGWVEAQDTVFSSRDWVGLGGNVAIRKDGTGPIAEVCAPLGEHGDLSVWVRLDCRVGGHDKHGMKGNVCKVGVRDGRTHRPLVKHYRRDGGLDFVKMANDVSNFPKLIVGECDGMVADVKEMMMGAGVGEVMMCKDVSGTVGEAWRADFGSMVVCYYRQLLMLAQMGECCGCRRVSRMWTWRGNGPCRDCEAREGRELSAGHGGQQDSALEYAAGMADLMRKIVVLLAPKPSYFGEVYTAISPLRAMGLAAAAMREAVRLLDPLRREELRRVYPPALMALFGAVLEYRSEEDVARNGVMFDGHVYRFDFLERDAWLDEGLYVRGPYDGHQLGEKVVRRASWAKTLFLLTELGCHDYLVGRGVSYRPLLESHHPLSYFGAYGEFDEEGEKRFNYRRSGKWGAEEAYRKVEGPAMSMDLCFDDYFEEYEVLFGVFLKRVGGALEGLVGMDVEGSDEEEG